MPFPIPNLDDRDFATLREEAIRAAARACPDWSDRSPGDPMVTLLEASAFLTDLLIYRVNRMPEKAYAAFLNLIGARLAPPSAAVAAVRFTRKRDVAGEIVVPAGARIRASEAGLVFVLAQEVRLPEFVDAAEGRALHCELVEGELLGVSTGDAGQRFRLKRPPVVAETGDGVDLVLGVSVERAVEGARLREFEGETYELWEEAESFPVDDPGRAVYLCDRREGLILFAPAAQAAGGAGAGAALARIPPAGRRIRVWYRRGGGAAGNVRPHLLDTLEAPALPVTVDNPERAAGGRDAEPLQSALRRGPHALRATRTAVTASDFERAALSSRGLARAWAGAEMDMWAHGRPGAVEVRATPYVDEALTPTERSLASTVESHQTPALLKRVSELLARRAPIGVTTAVRWARLKPISVRLSVVVFREEDTKAVERRLLDAVSAAVSPFAQRDFGQSLRASEIFELVAREPGVRYVDKLRFHVGGVPAEACRWVRADRFQRRAWHAAAGPSIYRSLDDGESWCEILRVQDSGQPVLCEPSPVRRGWLAAVTVGDAESAVHISMDCGESWRLNRARLGLRIQGAAWSASDGDSELFLATDKGLFVLDPLREDAPRRLVVMEGDDQIGFWDVATAPPIDGAPTLAVAAGRRRGVWISTGGGAARRFLFTGLGDADIRVLEVQSHGGRSFLWAGHAAAAGAEGAGCARLELRGSSLDPQGWRSVSEGWKGGSCEALAFAEDRVYAGTNRGGVLLAATGLLDRGWTSGPIDSGLPLRDEARLLHEVESLAARGEAGAAATVMTCGPKGVFRSRDGGGTWLNVTRTVLEEGVALSEAWLPASAEHAVEVRTEGAAR